MITLTGPGGIGKTRLALRAAAAETDRFSNGVLFVDLSSSRDSDSVVAAIARAVGLISIPDEAPVDRLREWLREEQILLVLDNFEQVTAAPIMARLLQECRGLKLLVTSREALHIRGEQLFVVPPLSSPNVALRKASVEELERFEAVQLFVERARAVRPDFVLTDDNAAAVADICIRLDGLPLAIELATARLTIFSPEALRDRLSSRLQLLRSGARDLPLRQQTLRGTIEWSYMLLDQDEQRLFELLSTFSGASFEAIEAVAAVVAPGVGIDPLDGLASLVDKSLIRQVDRGGTQPRLTMLETIREYAAERLDQLPEFRATTRRVHAAYFADFARKQWEELLNRRSDSAQAALVTDAENLRVAWRYWVDEHDLDQLNKLVDSLWFLNDARGW